VTQLLPLRESVQVTLNGSGAGTIKLGPQSHRETWRAPAISVKTKTPVTVGTCQCNIYVGTDATDSNFRDGTFSGDTGDTSDAIADDIRLPNAIFVVWTGGTPNDTATAIVTGTKELQ
jgi:hypothetical protein